MKSIDLAGMSVLIVDANPLLRTVFRQVLRELGARDIIAMASPTTGFTKFRENNPDIVLIDWGPNCDGLTLLHCIRTDVGSPNPFVPVIITSAFTEPTAVIEARDTGMSEFLAKPISAETLCRRIVRIAVDERPFVRTNSFFGPDRRRRHVAHPLVERRDFIYVPGKTGEQGCWASQPVCT